MGRRQTIVMEIIDRKFETKTATDTDGSQVANGVFDDDNLEAEAERLRKELEIERDARLRLAAEYQNYRRRTDLEKARAADDGKRELLTQLLSIVDDLDLAESGSDEAPKAVVEGVRMIRRRFLDLLGANGVVAFKSKGERFDPERHEAFAISATEGRNAGTVHVEMRRGYFWNDKVLRPALVIVEQ